MKPQAKPLLRRIRKITTFEESAEAAKLLARAVYLGILDAAGSDAELDPIEIVLGKTDEVIGATFMMKLPDGSEHSLREGEMERDGYTVQLTKTGSNVSFLRPVFGNCIPEEVIADKYEIVLGHVS